MRNKLKIASVVAVAAILNACAADDLQIWKHRGSKGSEEFQRVLGQGKAPARLPATSSRGFSLTANPSVFATEVDPGDGRASFVAYDTSRMPDVPRAGLKAAALAHVDANKETFGVPSSELVPMENFEIVDASGTLTLSFQRFVESIPVDSSLLQVAFTPQGGDVFRIRHVVNHSYGDIRISATEKMNLADQSDAGLAASLGLSRLVEIESNPVIYPRVNDKGIYEHSLAMRYVLQDQESGEHFTVVAKAGGELLEATPSRLHVSHQLLLDTWDRTPASNKRVSVPIGYVSVQGQVTDKNGRADLTLGQSLTIPLDAAGNGSRIAIQAAPTVTLNTVANTESSTYLTTANPGLANLPALNAYVKINIVADFVKQYLPNNPFTARQVTTIVNINDTCNAFYDPNAVTVNFFRADNQCQNTALIDDVVYHEWGHGLDDFTGPQRGIVDGAYSEGIGDILSMLITGSNNLAPGFLLANPANGIRNLENNKVFPGSVLTPEAQQVHANGEIIGATFWDIRKGMATRFGGRTGTGKTARLFLNSLMTTTRYTDSYQQVLLLDDNDGNPATRSPNFCLLNDIYARRGFATLEANCVDTFVPYDESLKLAIRSMTGTSVITLFGASSPDSAKIGVCLGEREACIANKKVDAEFADDRMTPDGIKIYKSETPIQLTDGQLVTVMGFDAQGNVRSATTVIYTMDSFQPQG